MGKRERHIYEGIAVFFVFSFLGWLMETVICVRPDGSVEDRGFLRLPLCTIYGFTILLIHAFLGTPQEGGVFLKRVKTGMKRLTIFYLLATFLATAMELFTGMLFETVFRMRLWDYSWHKFHFMGHISLGISLIWGVLIMAVMQGFPMFMNWIKKIPDSVLKYSGMILCTLTFLDYFYCLLKALGLVR